MCKFAAILMVIISILSSNFAMAMEWKQDQEVIAVTTSYQGLRVNCSGTAYWSSIDDPYTNALFVAFVSAQAMRSKVNIYVDGTRLYAVTIVSNQ